MKHALTMLCALFIFACSDGGGSFAPDYSQKANWLHFGGTASKGVDIFVIYPTVMSSAANAGELFIPIDDAVMHGMAAQWYDMMVADLVEDSGNVYAPYYRGINGLILGSLQKQDVDSYSEMTPRSDTFAAFAYYLRNVNKGRRPFVLLGYSQGAKMVIELACDLLASPQYSQYADQLVAAYAIGMSVTAAQVAHNPKLKFSTSATDTGVILSWNTTAPSETTDDSYKHFATWAQGALVTNPLTWVRDGAASASTAFSYTDSMSMQLLAGNVKVHADNAKGLLIADEPAENRVPDSPMPSLSRFHGSDIGFYSASIKANIEARIAAF